MVEHSADFLRKRLSTEFIPFAMKFLKTNQSTFIKSKSQYSQVHKVLNKLISFLGDILPHLDVERKQFCDVVTVCLPYLSCNLHQSVQNVSFFYIIT